jgi:Fe-S-cluster-containing dehydrogenase component
VAHEGAAQPSLARINVLFDEFDEKEPVTAHYCFQCAEAACLESCPAEAMFRDPRTGVVLVDEDRCIGCMACRRACPWDVPKRHPERKVAIKCDLCHDCVDGPLCVAMCPLSGRALRHEVSAASETLDEGVVA